MHACASLYPTGLSHAASRRPEQAAPAEAGGETLDDDPFVPKQLGRACCLGLGWFSPALTVRRRPSLSAGVRGRCHAARHAPLNVQSPTEPLSVPAFRVSSARSASGGSSSEGNGCIPGLSGGGPENRPGSNRRSGFVDGQRMTCQSRPRSIPSHGHHLFRSSGRIGQGRSYRPPRSAGGTVPGGVACWGCGAELLYSDWAGSLSRRLLH